MKYFLQTQRLGFRTWKPSDLHLAEGLWGDPEVTGLIDTRSPLSMDQIRERLEQEIRNHHNYGVQYWPMFSLDSKEHIGCCGLRPYNLENDIYELGFHIRSQYWQNGYATEAAKSVIEYAFNHLQASALFAGHNPKNKASRHLLLKLGFHYTQDEYYVPTGLMHPSYILER